MRYVSFFSGIEMATLAWHPLGWTPVAFAEIDPFACALLAHYYPQVPNLGDVSKISDEQIESLGAIDLFVMGFPCFPRGTYVLTQRGFIDISEIVVGDMVWTHRNRWRPVSKHHGSRVAETVRLRGHGGSVVTTGNHRFYAASGSLKILGRGRSTRSLSEPGWVEASDMEGMYWASPQHFNRVEAPVPSWVVNREAFFWAIGLWVADGWLVEFQRTGRSRSNSMARRVHWCAAKHQAVEVQRRLTEAGIATTRCDEATVTKFVKQSIELADYVAQFGKYAHGKSIPTWLLQASDVDKKAFLDGFLFGDGSANGDGWKATTVSKKLAIGVRLLATSIGWSVAAYFNERPKQCEISGRKCEQRDTWQLVAVPASKVGEWRSRDGHFYGLVRHVDPTGRAEEVFDIEVEEDHSFVADGMIVHNCQDVSQAGLRKGLMNDDGTPTRTGLFFDAMRLVRVGHRRCGARWLVGENVPGLYSSNAGRDFATVVGEIVGSTFDVPRSGWQNTGAAAGPRGMVEWSCLDAQWTGVAQRRERVFFVADFGDWSNRAPVLLEPESLSGDPPACVAQRQRSAARSSRGARRQSIWAQIAGAVWGGGSPRPSAISGALRASDGRNGPDADTALTGRLVPEVSGTLNANGKAAGSATQQDATSDLLVPTLCVPILEINKRAGKSGSKKDGTGVGVDGDPMFILQAGAQHGVALAFGGNNTSGPLDVATACRAKGGSGHGDFESETFIAHTLRADGFDASEDDTGRELPIIPLRASGAAGANGAGVGYPGDPMLTLDTGGSAAIAFSCKDDGRDATEELAPTMRSINFDKSHANAGGQLAVAFNARQDPVSSGDACLPFDTDGTSIAIAFDTTQITSGENRSNPKSGDPCHPLSATAHPPALATIYDVRRLLPVECERLQGVPDGYTAIPYRGKPAADGPRYKALGNGFAVPQMRWIGRRISAVCAVAKIETK